MERATTITPVKPKPGEMISLSLKIDRDGTAHGISSLPAWAFEQYKELIPQIEAEQDKCQGCNGLEECRRSGSLRGMVPELRLDGITVYEALTFCRYERQSRLKTKISRLCHSAQIPQMYKDSCFADYDVTPENKEAVKAARWLVGNNGRGQGLFIYGPQGAGKTMLAAIVANELVKQDKTVLFTSVPDLLDEIKATFSKSGVGTYDLIQSVKNVDVLVLDDLGAEKVSDWSVEQLFVIVNHRYNHRMTTVFTSNYSMRDLVNKMGVVDQAGGRRIMSRVLGMCQTVFLGGRNCWARRAQT